MWYYPVLKAGHCILAYQSIIEHFEFKHKWCCLKTQCLLIFEMATFVPACIIQQLCHIIERQFWRDTNDLLLNNLAFKRLIKNLLFAFEGIIANQHISSNGQLWFNCWCWSHQYLKSLWCLPLFYTRFSFCQRMDLERDVVIE